jgi:hypothetical protein
VALLDARLCGVLDLVKLVRLAVVDKGRLENWKLLVGLEAPEGVDSGRGQDDTLSVFSMPPDDIGDGIFRDAEVSGDPSV